MLAEPAAWQQVCDRLAPSARGLKSLLTMSTCDRGRCLHRSGASATSLRAAPPPKRPCHAVRIHTSLSSSHRPRSHGATWCWRPGCWGMGSTSSERTAGATGSRRACPSRTANSNVRPFPPVMPTPVHRDSATAHDCTAHRPVTRAGHPGRCLRGAQHPTRRADDRKMSITLAACLASNRCARGTTYCAGGLSTARAHAHRPAFHANRHSVPTLTAPAPPTVCSAGEYDLRALHRRGRAPAHLPWHAARRRRAASARGPASCRRIRCALAPARPLPDHARPPAALQLPSAPLAAPPKPRAPAALCVPPPRPSSHPCGSRRGASAASAATRPHAVTRREFRTTHCVGCSRSGSGCCGSRRRSCRSHGPRSVPAATCGGAWGGRGGCVGRRRCSRRRCWGSSGRCCYHTRARRARWRCRRSTWHARPACACASRIGVHTSSCCTTAGRAATGAGGRATGCSRRAQISRGCKRQSLHRLSCGGGVSGPGRSPPHRARREPSWGHVRAHGGHAHGRRAAVCMSTAQPQRTVCTSFSALARQLPRGRLSPVRAYMVRASRARHGVRLLLRLLRCAVLDRSWVTMVGVHPDRIGVACRCSDLQQRTANQV